MEFSFSNSRWLTESGSTEDLGNRNALGFHIPKMWDKILDNKCHLQEDPSNAIRNEVSFANGLTFFNPRTWIIAYVDVARHQQEKSWF
jgi:23S rRNA (uracil1939-C5)-methyltransferase